MIANALSSVGRLIVSWFDSDTLTFDPTKPKNTKTDISRWMPYLVLHGGCIGLFWVGFSWTAFWVAFVMYWVRMFAVTGIYHRYFSHRTYRMNRFWQFVFAIWGGTASQRGPLWWAAQHRHHHAHSDEPEDVHSPLQHGFYWAHIGWLTDRQNLATDMKMVSDLAKFPELVFLNRFDILVPFLTAVAMYGVGAAFEAFAPGLGTNGWQMLVWGFFVSTTILFHCTCFINSLAHVFGNRRYNTTDDSRNSLLLAIITMGEGWHNNHHRYPSSARQGFYWWELDVTYYILKGFQAIGVIRDLRPVPHAILEAGAGHAHAVQPAKQAA